MKWSAPPPPVAAAGLSATPPCPVQGLPTGPITATSMALELDRTSPLYVRTTEIFTEPDRWHYPRLRDIAIPLAW